MWYAFFHINISAYICIERIAKLMDNLLIPKDAV